MKTMGSPTVIPTVNHILLPSRRGLFQPERLQHKDSASSLGSAGASPIHRYQEGQSLKKCESNLSCPQSLRDLHAREDSSALWTLKADIQRLKSMTNDLRGRHPRRSPESVCGTIEAPPADDLQAELKSKLHYMEVRDRQMCQLESLLTEKCSALCPEVSSGLWGSRYSPRVSLTRMHSYMALVDLLLALAERCEGLQQSCASREALLQDTKAQLDASLSAAVEATQCLQAASAENTQLETALWAMCLERDAAVGRAEQLQVTLGSAEVGKGEVKEELAWFQKEHDRLSRECSFLGVEVRQLSSLEADVKRQRRGSMQATEMACDSCPALHALNNSLRQEVEEMKATIWKLKKERDSASARSEKQRQLLEAENHQSHRLELRLVALRDKHSSALQSLRCQDGTLLKLRHQLIALSRLMVLQEEAGERLALSAVEEADMHHILCNPWGPHPSSSRGVDLGQLQRILSEESELAFAEAICRSREEGSMPAGEVQELQTKLQHLREISVQLSGLITVAATLQDELTSIFSKIKISRQRRRAKRPASPKTASPSQS